MLFHRICQNRRSTSATPFSHVVAVTISRRSGQCLARAMIPLSNVAKSPSWAIASASKYPSVIWRWLLSKTGGRKAFVSGRSSGQKLWPGSSTTLWRRPKASSGVTAPLVKAGLHEIRTKPVWVMGQVRNANAARLSNHAVVSSWWIWLGHANAIKTLMSSRWGFKPHPQQRAFVRVWSERTL